MLKINKYIYIKNLIIQILKYKIIILINYNNINSNKINKIRKLIKINKSYIKVIKNNLLFLVFKKIFIFNKLNINKINNNTILLLSNNIINISKILNDLLKNKYYNIYLKFGYYNNQILNQNDIFYYSKIPSKKLLLIKLINLIKSPIINIIFILKQIILKKNE